jgi:hypothetical protein
MKIRRVGAELFHVNRQEDIMTLIVAFRNFAKAPKGLSLIFTSLTKYIDSCRIFYMCCLHYLGLCIKHDNTCPAVSHSVR